MLYCNFKYKIQRKIFYSFRKFLVLTISCATADLRLHCIAWGNLYPRSSL